MTEPFTPAAPEDHARHDPVWMAALATRDPDLGEAERTQAEAALQSCGACADLLAELVAVSAAIPAAAIPTRARDFTLTAADAARLRPGGIRGWLSGIGSVRDGITFPLAMGLTTIGIAGLLVATIPAAFSGMGGASSAAAPELRSAAGAPSQAPEAAAPAPAASAAASAILAPIASPTAASAAPAAGQADLNASSSPDTEITGEGGVFSGDDGDAASQAAQRQDAAEMARDAAIQDDGSGVSTLVVVALTLLIAGLGLFALRWSNRRFGNG